ncbi:MAG: thermonuclease family protein [Solirubrobacterales bacterium]
MHAKLVLIAALLTVAAPAGAGPARCAEDGDGGACVWGRAEAFDGGALQVRGLKVHLLGIAAPSRKDLCADKAKREEFDCARPARKRMGELVAKGVACDILDVGGDRLLGRCRVADGDLGRLLVASGVARAVKDGPYDPDQAAAVTAHRGLWHPDMVVPKEWEAVRRRAE